MRGKSNFTDLSERYVFLLTDVLLVAQVGGAGLGAGWGGGVCCHTVIQCQPSALRSSANQLEEEGLPAEGPSSSGASMGHGPTGGRSQGTREWLAVYQQCLPTSHCASVNALVVALASAGLYNSLVVCVHFVAGVVCVGCFLLCAAFVLGTPHDVHRFVANSQNSRLWFNDLRKLIFEQKKAFSEVSLHSLWSP